MSDFKTTFEKEIVKKLQEKLGVKNPMAIPRFTKVIISASSRDFLADKKNIETAKEDLTIITGQKPKITSARISVATFKLREGDKIGMMVTLRGKKMYDFMEKLVKIVLPRVRDFNGVSNTSFDGHGNMSMGFTEQTVFPEIDTGKVEKVRGLELTIVTSAKSDADARALLETIGVPFKKQTTA
jgi:large subunit ribosomal protein L5